MTDSEKRAHDLAVALIVKKEYCSLQDAFEEYKKTYFLLYDYVKETFREE